MPPTVDLPLPASDVHDVGPDARAQRGRRQRRVLRQYGLTRRSEVLEVGCGVGRLARELAQIIDEGSYTGFDIAPAAVQWLETNYASKLAHFAFDLVEVTSDRYQIDSPTAAAHFHFPYPSDRFDLVCSFAVFMHMQLDGVANYLREIERVLRPGGRAVLTMLAVHPDERFAPSLGGRRFIEIEPGVFSRHPDKPNASHAFAASLLSTTIADAGLSVVDQVEGSWHGRRCTDPEAAERQLGGDLFVLSPTRRSPAPRSSIQTLTYAHEALA